MTERTSDEQGREPEQADAETPTEVEVDVVVVGGGPAGENVAGRVRRGDLSVALVDAELFGGECSYWACMPSKALLRPVDLHAAAGRVPGLEVGDVQARAVLDRRDRFVSNFDDSSQVAWVEGVGAQVVRGTARLDGERTVRVKGPDGRRTVLRARHAVVLAVGTAAAVPPIPGLREAAPWTSREVTSARAVPRRLVVIGGGVVGCEMAQAHRGLGAEEVTLVEATDRLLPRNEPMAAAMLHDALTESGITVRTGVGVASVQRPQAGGEVTVVLEDGTEVRADEVVVATGRRPRTEGLGLETVGLPEEALASGYVPVDDTTTVRGPEGAWLYAVGDVTGRNLLTHMGKYEARVCGDVIVARSRGEDVSADVSADSGRARSPLRVSADALGAPAVIFTDPQVASVGRTLEQARSQGLRVRGVEYDIGAVAGAALLADGYRGRALIAVDEDRRVIVGATFVGQDVAELLHSATVAVVAEVPLDVLWHAVPSYPTISEVWLRLLEEYGL